MERMCKHPQVRGELAPWERQMQEVQSHMDVASSERDLLRKKAADAATRLEELRSQLAAAVAAVADKEAELGRNAKEVAATK
jgi:chromosome segregation ATPase